MGWFPNPIGWVLLASGLSYGLALEGISAAQVALLNAQAKG